MRITKSENGEKLGLQDGVLGLDVGTAVGRRGVGMVGLALTGRLEGFKEGLLGLLEGALGIEEMPTADGVLDGLNAGWLLGMKVG